MVSILKSSGNGETGTDIQAIMTDLASLRDDIAALTKHVSHDAYDASGAVAGKLNAEATKAYNNMAAQGQRSVKMISHQGEEQPLATLLIAFALGFVGSRMLQR